MSDAPLLFSDLALSEPILQSLKDLGYESPSPIQAATIPLLLANRDILGQAQTGTGKTAAFALPILMRLDPGQSAPQALVLVPTRELAIQVAEAFQRYASHIPGFHVLPIYGGQSYGPQLSALRRGLHVVVGTPGRVIDHLSKGSLDLSQLRTLVLDEADEMLRMGFIEEVERILQETPKTRQTALFSATLPPAIKRIAQTYLRDPKEVTVAAKTGTADNIRQRYWLVSGLHKLDALTRILEAEPFDAMIIFSRTKLGTEDLALKLQARGFSAAAINGDLAQQQRERTIGQLKDGSIDILVATDVAARGLDVERITHVFNYDMPTDPESYTHRIGRTGRAGRSGEAIMFVTPRERGLLRAIERATRQPISALELPTIQAVNNVRIARFKQRIAETLQEGGLETFVSIVEDYEREHDVSAVQIAAALAKITRRGVPLLMSKPERSRPGEESESLRSAMSAPVRSPASAPTPYAAGRAAPATEYSSARARPGTEAKPMPTLQPGFARVREPSEPVHAPAGDAGSPLKRVRERSQEEIRPKGIARPREEDSRTYRVEVGHAHGIKPSNLVGAIANETGLPSKFIGRIRILDNYSLLDLPVDMPKPMLRQLQTVRVGGQPLRISVSDEIAPAEPMRSRPAGGAKPPWAGPSPGAGKPAKYGKPKR